MPTTQEESALRYIFLTAGISHPTEQDNACAMEAMEYANINLYTEKPMSISAWANKKMFEIKAISKFMRSKNFNNHKAQKYFHDKERRELLDLACILSYPLTPSECTPHPSDEGYPHN